MKNKKLKNFFEKTEVKSPRLNEIFEKTNKKILNPSEIIKNTESDSSDSCVDKSEELEEEKVKDKDRMQTIRTFYRDYQLSFINAVTTLNKGNGNSIIKY